MGEELYELPTGWVWIKLDEITEITLGQSPPSSSYNEDRIGLPFYQGKAEFGQIYPIPQKWCSFPNKIAQEGDVLISVRAPVGSTNICPAKSCIGRGLASVHGLGGIKTFFLFYLIRAFNQKLLEKSTGTTFDAISGNVLRELKLPLPPLPEQYRIVTKIEELFTELDAGVELLKKLKAKLKRYRQAVLKAAVEGSLTKEWREANQGKLEPASVLLERILKQRRKKWEAEQLAKMKAQGKTPKDDSWKLKYKEPVAPDTSDLPELPDGWCWANIEMIGDIIGGLTQNSKRENLPLKMPYLRVANVYAGKLQLDEIYHIGVQPSEINRVLLQKGDLLVVEGNGSIEQIGRVALWDGSISPCLHQNHLIKVRFNPIEIAKYVILWLLSIGGRNQITRVASSTSGLHTLSISKVAALTVPLSPMGEQIQIFEEVERLFSVIDQLEKTIDTNLKRSEKLRQSILKQAFEGKLVPQDPNDEPAEKLLEQIKAEKAKQTTTKTKRKTQPKSQSNLQLELPLE